MAGKAAFAAVAVSASGTSDSGPAREAVDCCGPFPSRAASGLVVLLAGRSRGSGMGSDGCAAWMVAITTLKPRVATAIGRKVFTIPPETSVAPANLLACRG